MTMLVLAPLLATAAGEDPASRFIRLLTVFLLAMWVGFEVITKVPQRLHTPLTSGSNAISGITAVGNVVGGFVVTDRMLQMFKRRPDPPDGEGR